MWLQEKGFLHIHTPILTSSDCEGAGETFLVTTDKHIDSPLEEDSLEDQIATDESDSESDLHFFRKPVYLTVSGQLHLEACALGMGNVYTLSPVFRAENNLSKKHLSEFRMLEVELAFTQVRD